MERGAVPLTPEQTRRPGHRDRVVFQDTGLRISERLNLTVIRHGKGDKDRVVPLTPDMGRIFQRYLETVRPALVCRNSVPTVRLSFSRHPLAAAVVGIGSAIMPGWRV